MRYNEALYKDLRHRIGTADGATNISELEKSLRSIVCHGNTKVYINAESSLYEIGSIDLHKMIDSTGNEIHAVCITAKTPDWVIEYDKMNAKQLIEELGKQSSRRAEAMYLAEHGRIDMKIYSDADDRMSYINDRLRKLRFGDKTK